MVTKKLLLNTGAIYEQTPIPKKFSRSIRIILIREDLVNLTGDFRSAVVLNQLIYWTQRSYNFAELLQEEYNHSFKHHPVFRHGWVIKFAQELIVETMMGLSRQTMCVLLKSLVEKGWIRMSVLRENRRPKAVQYRLSLIKLHQDLQAIGYTLDNFTFESNLSGFQILSSQQFNGKDLTLKNPEGSRLHFNVKNLTMKNNEEPSYKDANGKDRALNTPEESRFVFNVKNLTMKNSEKPSHKGANGKDRALKNPEESRFVFNVKNLTMKNSEKPSHKGANGKDRALKTPEESRFVFNVKNLTMKNNEEPSYKDASGKDLSLKTPEESRFVFNVKNLTMKNNEEPSHTFARAHTHAYKINYIYKYNIYNNIYSLSPFPSLSQNFELEPTAKNERENISQKMLQIFSEVVLNGQALALYPARAQMLQRVLIEQFNDDLESWRKVCHNITCSKFLMGESKSSNFKVGLDWLLEERNATKVFEGAYGVGDRVVAPNQPQANPEDLAQTIEAQQDHQEMKAMRLWFVQRFGAFDYNAWFKEAAFQGFDGERFTIAVTSSFIRDQITCRFASYIWDFLKDKYKKRISFEILLKPTSLTASSPLTT